MRILVTGAGGFIGFHALLGLRRKGHVVIGTTHDYAVKDANMMVGDVTDRRFIERLVVENDIDVIIHLAARSIVKHSWKSPWESYLTNVMGTVSVFEAARIKGDVHVIYQSTDKVYGDGVGKSTEDRLVPTEPYGTSKACGDFVAQSYMMHYGIKTTILRPCNVYGFDTNNRIIPNTIRSCLQGIDPVIYKGTVGMRQYVFIEDLIDNYEKIILENVTGAHNVAPMFSIRTQEDVVLEILKHFPGMQPVYVDSKNTGELDEQSLIPDENLSCPTSFEDGITKTVAMYRKITEVT